MKALPQKADIQAHSPITLEEKSVLGWYNCRIIDQGSSRARTGDSLTWGGVLSHHSNSSGGHILPCSVWTHQSIRQQMGNKIGEDTSVCESVRFMVEITCVYVCVFVNVCVLLPNRQKVLLAKTHAVVETFGSCTWMHTHRLWFSAFTQSGTVTAYKSRP